MGNLFCCIQVHQSTVAIKERFGKFEEVLEPGCHFLPWILGYQRAGNVSLRLQELEVNCEVKTKDNTFVYIIASVYYQALADKAVDVFYKLSDTRSLIKTYVISVTRAVVAKRNLRDIFGRRTEIAKAVDKELEKAMSDYGYKVVQTLIIDMRADMLIEEAMEEINAANRKARAEKILQIKRAEGNLPGLSIAPQHQAIVDGLRYSELGFSENVPRETANDVIDMDIVTQY